jgi:hypothetical protein
MRIDPRDAAHLDAMIDSTRRKKSRRTWPVWLIVAVTSLGLILLAQFDSIHLYLRATMAVTGLVGLLLFLVFLSTKPYGRGNSSGFWGWW